MKFNLALFIFALSLITCNEQKFLEKVYYVTDVEAIEYLTVKYCVDKNGKFQEATIVQEKTTYNNHDIVKNILKQKHPTIREMYGDCFDITYRFINKKYENKIVSEMDCEKYTQFKTGNFKYAGVLYPNTLITRTDSTQISRDKDVEFISTISWQSACEYNMTFVSISNSKYDSFIGKTAKVNFIDILPNGDYVYKSNFLNESGPPAIGIMKKI